ncbi:MAG: dynamin family protein [Planctomycetota bacterium]|jgi:hypothetical protein|nr:dynamin family protein [Planctomycetota bacterium]
MKADGFPEYAETKTLSGALEQLGRHILFSRGKILAAAMETLQGIDAHLGTLEEDGQKKDAMIAEASKHAAGLRRDKEGLQKDVQEANERVSGLSQQIKTLNADKEGLQKDIQRKDKQIRKFGLVSDALKAKPAKREAARKFERLLQKDCEAFYDIEPTLKNVETHERLWQILEEMRLFAVSRDLCDKTIGAIGGGFSSGKSAFINSLLARDAGVRLAEGIRPVTAIPSYVVGGEAASIEGVNDKGGAFEIAPDLYREISHEFLRSFPFDLKKIIPYIIVRAPLSEERFGDLCLIDTPGYNPAAAGSAESDMETARKYIRDKDARFLVWMVGLDANGTLPQSDLDFLEGLEFGQSEERPLYLIANKAELKPAGEIEEILDEFESCLEDAGLTCAGICAYSLKNGKVYATRGQDLFEFLEEYNAPRERHGDLLEALCATFRPRVEEIHADDWQRSEHRKRIRELLMEALKAGLTDVESSENGLEEGLLALERDFTHAETLEVRIERLRTLSDKFFDCLDDFCAEVGMEKTDVSEDKKALFDAPVFDLPRKKRTDKRSEPSDDGGTIDDRARPGKPRAKIQRSGTDCFRYLNKYLFGMK